MFSPTPKPGVSEESFHILVVEDDVILRFTLSEWLRQQGHVVFEAGSAEQATVILASPLEVSLVITDIEMPGKINGYGLVRYIQKHLPALPIIMVSGNMSREEVARAGVYEFYQKPYDFHELAARVAQLLPRRQTREDI